MVRIYQNVVRIQTTIDNNTYNDLLDYTNDMLYSSVSQGLRDVIRIGLYEIKNRPQPETIYKRTKEE